MGLWYHVERKPYEKRSLAKEKKWQESNWLSNIKYDNALIPCNKEIFEKERNLKKDTRRLWYKKSKGHYIDNYSDKDNKSQEDNFDKHITNL